MRGRVTRMTTKGQVVIPKVLRDRTGLGVGDSVSLAIKEEDVHLAKRSGWAKATAGCLASPHTPFEPQALDELSEQIAVQEAREKYGDTG